MIPNLDQLLLVCGIVSLVVIAIVYVLVTIINVNQADNDSDQAGH